MALFRPATTAQRALKKPHAHGCVREKATAKHFKSLPFGGVYSSDNHICSRESRTHSSDGSFYVHHQPAARSQTCPLPVPSPASPGCKPCLTTAPSQPSNRRRSRSKSSLCWLIGNRGYRISHRKQTKQKAKQNGLLQVKVAEIHLSLAKSLRRRP